MVIKMGKKRKNESMLGLAKETAGVGVASMAGMGVIGVMGGIPGMPAQASHVTQAAGAGLTLVNVGQMAKVGMAIPRAMGGVEKKKSGNKYIDRMI